MTASVGAHIRQVGLTQGPVLPDPVHVQGTGGRGGGSPRSPVEDEGRLRMLVLINTYKEGNIARFKTEVRYCSRHLTSHNFPTTSTSAAQQSLWGQAGKLPSARCPGPETDTHRFGRVLQPLLPGCLLTNTDTGASGNRTDSTRSGARQPPSSHAVAAVDTAFPAHKAEGFDSVFFTEQLNDDTTQREFIGRKFAALNGSPQGHMPTWRGQGLCVLTVQRTRGLPQTPPQPVSLVECSDCVCPEPLVLWGGGIASKSFLILLLFYC